MEKAAHDTPTRAQKQCKTGEGQRIKNKQVKKMKKVKACFHFFHSFKNFQK